MTFKEIDIEADDEAAHEAPTAPVDITKINTLHELLGLAIGDFEKVLADERYAIHMGRWHAPGEDGDPRCHVCLAGSVLAKTVKLDIDIDADEVESSIWANEALSDRLHVLDDLRLGYIRTAYFTMFDVDRRQDCPDIVNTLHAKWYDAIPFDVGRATDRTEGRQLLAYLKDIHADLVEAGL